MASAQEEEQKGKLAPASEYTDQSKHKQMRDEHGGPWRMSRSGRSFTSLSLELMSRMKPT
eukprot:6212581-Pleurochrysis_carterae.AAC.7